MGLINEALVQGWKWQSAHIPGVCVLGPRDNDRAFVRDLVYLYRTNCRKNIAFASPLCPQRWAYSWTFQPSMPSTNMQYIHHAHPRQQAQRLHTQRGPTALSWELTCSANLKPIAWGSDKEHALVTDFLVGWDLTVHETKNVHLQSKLTSYAVTLAKLTPRFHVWNPQMAALKGWHKPG